MLRDDGRPAWIVEGCFSYTAPQPHEVRTLTGVVSSGRGIDPGSLRLTGDAITWIQDGGVRQSPIESRG